MIKVGFIGAGDIAYLHGEGVQQAEGAQSRPRNPNIPGLDARPSHLTWSDRYCTPRAYESREHD